MSTDSHNGHSTEMETTRMSSDTAKEEPTTSEASSSEVHYEDTDVLAQLRELGGNLIAAVQAIGQSEQVRTMLHDLGNGLRNVGEQVSNAAQNASHAEVVKGVKEQATKVTEHPVVRDMQTNITQALRELNKRFAAFAESARSGSGTAPKSEDAAQLTLPGEVGDTTAPDGDKPTTKLNA